MVVWGGDWGRRWPATAVACWAVALGLGLPLAPLLCAASAAGGDVSDSAAPSAASDPVATAVSPGKAEGLVIATAGRLPVGAVGSPYSLALSADGGTPPYTWSRLSSVGFPAGLSLQPDGWITGTPTAEAKSGFQACVTDATGVSATAAFALTIGPPERLAYTWSWLAGRTRQSGDTDGTLTEGRFREPYGLALDAGGTLYVADTLNHTVRRITREGVVTTLAGSPGVSGAVDGTGSEARFAQPCGITVDAEGTLFVADIASSTIRKVTPAGEVTTLAGSAGNPGSTDGVGPAAQFYAPSSLVLDSTGNLFVADRANHTIRKLTPDGAVSTFVGQAGVPGSADGTGSAARLSWPWGLAVDAADNLYVTSTSAVRKVTPAGIVTTLAGSGDQHGNADGTGSAARFSYPRGLAIDAEGTLIVADGGNDSLRRVTLAGVVTTIGAGGPYDGYVNSLGYLDEFVEPRAVAADPSGLVYVVDASSAVIRGLSRRRPAAVTPSPLPVGTVGAFYRAPLLAYGGTRPLSWALVSGALPAGLVLDADGAVRGTPQVSMTTALAVRVTGADSLYVEQDLVLTIAADDDRDGLPDDWEQALVDADPADGLAAIAEVTPDGDPDGDGGSNAEELFWGTDPGTAESGLALDWADAVARLRAIGVALMAYQADHGVDVLPGRLMQLVTDGYLTAGQLVCRADPFHGAQGGGPDGYLWGQKYEEAQETGSSFDYQFSEAPCLWVPSFPTWCDYRMHELEFGNESGHPQDRSYDRRVFPVVRCYWLEYPGYGGAYPESPHHVPFSSLSLAVDCRSVFGADLTWESAAWSFSPDEPPRLRGFGPTVDGWADYPLPVVRAGEPIRFPLWPKVWDVDAVRFRLVPGAAGRVYGALCRNVYSWTPGPDAPARAVITVEMLRGDGADEEVLGTESFQIEVTPNHAPVLDAMGPRVVDEDTLLSFTVTASDPDDTPADGLALSATGLPEGAVLVSTTGEFSWTPGESQQGTYEVTFTVTDDGTPALTDAEVVTITVVETNRPPQITSDGGGETADVAVPERQTAVTTVTAVDPDIPEQALVVTLAGGADRDLFELAGDTGRLSFCSAPDFEAPGDADRAGVYEVLVRAADGAGGVGVQVLRVRVTDLIEHRLAFAAGAGGHLEGDLLQDLVEGADATPVSAVPDAHWSFRQWLVDAEPYSNANPLTVIQPSGSMALTAEFALTEYTVTFAVDGDGALVGATSQTLVWGGSTTPVAAVPSAGSYFCCGEDGPTANPRPVAGVTADCVGPAHFRPLEAAAPEGPFALGYRGVHEAELPRIWDFTGHYETALDGLVLALDVTHDERGRLGGTGRLSGTAGGRAVEVTEMALRGRVRGAAGQVSLTVALSGRTGSVNAAVALDLGLDGGRLSGRATGTLREPGQARLRVVAPCVLALPGPMDGSHRLPVWLSLAADGRIAGTGELVLSNGRTVAVVVSGRRAEALAALALAGDRDVSPAFAPVKLRVTVRPYAHGEADIEALSGHAFGQELAWP